MLPRESIVLVCFNSISMERNFSELFIKGGGEEGGEHNYMSACNLKCTRNSELPKTRRYLLTEQTYMK